MGQPGIHGKTERLLYTFIAAHQKKRVWVVKNHSHFSVEK